MHVHAQESLDHPQRERLLGDLIVTEIQPHRALSLSRTYPIFLTTLPVNRGLYEVA